jgi:NADPH:quinone reductase-like Zn-dependent oxidoreductase
MDTQVTFRLTPKMIDRGLTDPQAATLGASIETACLGLFEGLHIPLSALDEPHPKHPAGKGNWLLVLGGASSVGKSAIQLAVAAGYRVLTSCSPSSGPLVEKYGAQWFSYKDDLETQVRSVLDKTGGDGVSLIFDAVASDDPKLAKALFKSSSSLEKYFATTNDWSGIVDFEGGNTYCIELGVVGRPEGVELNKKIEQYVAVCTRLLEEGKVVAGEYEVVGEGLEAAVQAYKYQQSGKAGNKKVVVKIGNE